MLLYFLDGRFNYEKEKLYECCTKLIQIAYSTEKFKLLRPRNDTELASEASSRISIQIPECGGGGGGGARWWCWWWW